MPKLDDDVPWFVRATYGAAHCAAHFFVLACEFAHWVLADGDESGAPIPEEREP